MADRNCKCCNRNISDANYKKNLCRRCSDYHNKLFSKIDSILQKNSQSVKYNKMSEPAISIYYACSCGFRSFWKSEVDDHLEETAEDVHEHKIVSVYVDKAVE